MSDSRAREAAPARSKDSNPGQQETKDSPARGFAARFDDVSLWDLVQFECLRRQPERALRVASQGQQGFLYFRDGNVVHATTARATGERAMREMLGWPGGSVEPWPARWPERESILATPNIEPPVTAPPPVRRTVEKVALAPNGRVVLGGGVHGLPEAAAYAAQMADLIGEFLGLEGFRSLEASFGKRGSEQVMVTRSKDGGLVAQRDSTPDRRPPPREGRA